MPVLFKPNISMKVVRFAWQMAAYRANKVLICHGEVIDVLYPDLLQSLNLKRCGLQMAMTQRFHQN